ncbi:MAG: hypothetical protein K1X54_10800 [Flavobacteriales bacterium]|nr:hypothetical protein [Flavobacteriales bacterium]
MLIRKELIHECEVDGKAEEYFKVLSDVSKWYQWSPNISQATLAGPFKEGSFGLVEPKRMSFCQLLIGKTITNQKVTLIFKIPLSVLYIEYNFFKGKNGQTIIQRKSTLHGFVGYVLYILRAKSIKNDFEQTIQALHKQAMRLRRFNMHAFQK